MTRGLPISLSGIEAAQDRLTGLIRMTPVEISASLSEKAKVPVMLKMEHHQQSGSFKFRGATNAVAQLTDKQRTAGVVGVSTGNHGRGLARACAGAGVRCLIVMSSLVPANKVAAIRDEGAEVVIEGRSQDEAQLTVDRLVSEGLTMIPPFDHPHVIEGQGTLGLEMLGAMPDMTTAVIQLSGGGLIAGVATAIRALRPDVRIIGVSMARGAAMHASLAAGHPVEVPELPTLADSLGGGVGLKNRYTFEITRNLVDEVVLLEEREIAEAIRHCYWEERQIVEGSGAVGVGALLSGKVTANGPTMLLLSGGNIDMALHHRIVGGQDVDPGREAV